MIFFHWRLDKVLGYFSRFKLEFGFGKSLSITNYTFTVPLHDVSYINPSAMIRNLNIMSCVCVL